MIDEYSAETAAAWDSFADAIEAVSRRMRRDGRDWLKGFHPDRRSSDFDRLYLELAALEQSKMAIQQAARAMAPQPAVGGGQFGSLFGTAIGL